MRANSTVVVVVVVVVTIVSNVVAVQQRHQTRSTPTCRDRSRYQGHRAEQSRAGWGRAKATSRPCPSTMARGVKPRHATPCRTTNQTPVATLSYHLPTRAALRSKRRRRRRRREEEKKRTSGREYIRTETPPLPSRLVSSRLVQSRACPFNRSPSPRRARAPARTRARTPCPCPCPCSHDGRVRARHLSIPASLHHTPLASPDPDPAQHKLSLSSARPGDPTYRQVPTTGSEMQRRVDVHCPPSHR